MNKASASVGASATELAAPVLWRVLQAAHELESRLEAALAAAGLSMAKAGLLRCLAQAKEPMALSEVAEHSRCVRSNITQLVDRLEADGLVRRVADPTDRRVRRATLTPAGRKAYQDAVRITETQEREVAGALSTAEAKALALTLGRLAS
ncbi:MAG: MarR family transcriptional regulator [Gemmatimonadetes bacterium]|nr:MarR family transcriptional regulator [Gemmatimonadota bacterium]